MTVMGSHHTEHVAIDAHRCEACGHCVEACRHQALGMVSFLFHKHAKVSHADRCRGCLRCVRACQHGAIQALQPRPPRRQAKAEATPAGDLDPTGA
jgi:Fe-S-cluster-containing hydrogenase component 2